MEQKEESIQFKDQGNDFYNKKQYKEAIKAYTQAIVNPFYPHLILFQSINSTNPIYFNNRAKCYK